MPYQSARETALEKWLFGCLGPPSRSPRILKLIDLSLALVYNADQIVCQNASPRVRAGV
jgi:hypothetical protein